MSRSFGTCWLAVRSKTFQSSLHMTHWFELRRPFSPLHRPRFKVFPWRYPLAVWLSGKIPWIPQGFLLAFSQFHHYKYMIVKKLDMEYTWVSGCNQTPFIFKYIIFKIMRNRLAIILCLIYAVKTEILHESTNKLLKVKLNSILSSID